MIDETLTAESGKLQEVLTDAAHSIVARLCKVPIPEDPGAVTLVSLTEADFEGYQAWEIEDWDIVQNEFDELGEAISEPIQFIAGEDVVAQPVYGMFVTLKNGDEAETLWQVMRFEQPFAFDLPGRVLELQVRVDSYDDTLEPA